MSARPTPAQLARLQKPKTLKVRPNPDYARDKNGEPCCAVMVEGVINRFVGARIDHERSKAEGKIYFLFDADEDTTVPDTRYYRNALACGELLASPSCEHTKSLALIVAESDKHDKFCQESLVRFLGPDAALPDSLVRNLQTSARK